MKLPDLSRFDDAGVLVDAAPPGAETLDADGFTVHETEIGHDGAGQQHREGMAIVVAAGAAAEDGGNVSSPAVAAHAALAEQHRAGRVELGVQTGALVGNFTLDDSGTFVIAGQCGIPTGAVAVAFNFTITQPTGQGDLRTVPGGGTLPLVSTMNWRAGQTRANNGIVPLGPSGDTILWSLRLPRVRVEEADLERGRFRPPAPADLGEGTHPPLHPRRDSGQPTWSST